MQEIIPNRKTTRESLGDTLPCVTIGERILAIRTERGITQERLAEAAGLGQGLISKYEAGTQEPSVESAKGIARALHITMDELCGVHEERGVEALRGDVGPLSKNQKRLVVAYKDGDAKVKAAFKALLDLVAPVEKGGEE